MICQIAQFIFTAKLQGRAGSKTFLQQNLPVLNWGCQLIQVVLYIGHKMVVLVVVVVVMVLVVVVVAVVVVVIVVVVSSTV